ncbi:MAG: chloride channel protein, partial [Ilumatobacteraceae bacterium]|nr:chloride channel protein [Ilumatobacteraceae bacterium]
MLTAPIRATTHLLVVTSAACLIGAVSGLTSWALFEALDHATTLRLDHTWLVWLLPVAALTLGSAYHYFGGASNGGTSLVIEQSLPPRDATAAQQVPEVPYRMAPMIFGATFIAQLTGASVGREGAALQISGSVTSLLTSPFRLRPSDTRLMLIAAMAGAFGGAFGVPMAGAIFGLEVQQTGRLRYEGLAPALAASITADLIVESLGRHTPMVNIPVNIDWSIALRLVLVGIAAGLAARLFIEVLHGVKKTISDLISWVPGRPVIGALATLALMLIFGRDYLGLSLPLVEQALGGSVASWWDPVLKILFTAIALGCAIPGGEVTPLFVVGATLGSAMSGPLHLSPTLTAAACLAAVFGAAANAPIACA